MDENNTKKRDLLDFVRVGEYSREIARKPIHLKVEEIIEEREELISKKREIELAIGEVAEWKRLELASVYSSKFPKSRACELTNSIEAAFIEKRRPLLTQLHAVNERIQQLKTQRQKSESRKHEEREDVVLLRKILASLSRIEQSLQKQ